MPAKPRPKFTWDQIDSLRTRAGMAREDVPTDAFTIPEYAAQYGLPYGTAFGQLARLARAGQLKTGKKWTTVPSGRQGSMRYYWPA